MTFQQLLTFLGRDLAHRGKSIGSMGSRFFKRVLGLHVQFFCHLVAVIALHIIIQRFAIATDAASYTCSMCGEDSSDIGQVGLHIEQPHASGPLVEMCDDT